jgi:Flp pilus assembly protein TadG
LPTTTPARSVSRRRVACFCGRSHRPASPWHRPSLPAIRRDAGGAIAVVTALALTVLIGVIGLAIDVASWQVTTRQMQGAADQAAIGAVLAYLAGGGDDPTTQAKGITANYGFTDGQSRVAVSVVNVSPSPTGYDAAYTVTITQPQPQYFSSVFLSGITVGVTAEAATVGNGPCVLSLNPSASGAVTVSGSGTLNLTNCDMDVNSTNSSDAVDSGGACIFAQNINVGGGTSPTPSTGTACTGGTIKYSGKYKTGTTTADPYANRTKPTVGTCPTVASPVVTWSGQSSGTTVLLPGKYTSSITISGGSVTLSAGNYYFQNGITITGGTVTFSAGNYSGGSGININGTANSTVPTVTLGAGNYCGGTTGINGGTVTLSPGTYSGGIGSISNSAKVTFNAGVYVMNGGNVGFQISGSSPANVVTATAGVTIYLTDSSGGGHCGKIDISGGQTINITAPTSGATAGIAFWVDNTIANCPANTQVSFSGGSAANVTGAIYAPANQVTYSGGSAAANGCTQIVSDTLTISGPSYVQHNCTGTGVSDPANSARVALIQ